VAETGSKTIRYDKHGVHVLGVVNVAGAAKDGEAGTSRTRVSSRQRVRVVQRDGGDDHIGGGGGQRREDARETRPGGAAKGGDRMTETPQEYRSLSREELEAITGGELPERAAMSLINANVAAPVNVAAALNVLSDNSTAIANAEQTADISQSTGPTTTSP
jgi:hypothetical protein